MHISNSTRTLEKSPNYIYKLEMNSTEVGHLGCVRKTKPYSAGLSACLMQYVMLSINGLKHI